MAGLAPLHDRIRFLKQGRFASLRQAQLELQPFDAERLRGVALRLRELFPPDNRSRIDQRVSTEFIGRLVTEVTAGFKGDVGVVPRQFLREFVTQMDLVVEHPDYDPMSEYGFKLRALSLEEQHALEGGAFRDLLMKRTQRKFRWRMSGERVRSFCASPAACHRFTPRLDESYGRCRRRQATRSSTAIMLCPRSHRRRQDRSVAVSRDFAVGQRRTIGGRGYLHRPDQSPAQQPGRST